MYFEWIVDQDLLYLTEDVNDGWRALFLKPVLGDVVLVIIPVDDHKEALYLNLTFRTSYRDGVGALLAVTRVE